MALFIIDDTNADVHLDSKDPRCGTLPPQHIYGSLESAPASAIKSIPMEQWPDLIADMDRNKSWAKDRWEDSPIGVLDQGQISYCHGFSAVLAAMIQRRIQGEPYVELSPSSVAAPITNYTNQGAVISDDLEQMVKVGIASTEFVPMLTTRRQDFKPGWEQDAAKHRVVLFEELRPRDFLQQGTVLLSGGVLCNGLNYWGHAVTDVKIHDLYPNLAATNMNRYGIEFINSWKKTWGNNGCGVRNGSKAPADSMYIPKQVRPSVN